MRRALTLLVPVLAAGLAVVSDPASAADEAPRLVLCLEVAADGSPVYPLSEVPANHKEIVVAWRLREGEKADRLVHTWTAVDVGEAAPAGTEIAKETLELKGGRSGPLRFSLPRDLPQGAYRLDVTADATAWPALSFRVGPPTTPTPLKAPRDLLPLASGTTWRYAHTIEAGPVVKKLSVAGMEKGPDGKLHGTVTYTAAGSDKDGTRIEIRRGDTLLVEQWWRVDEGGLVVTREKQGEQETPMTPPLPMLRLPLEAPSAWEWKSDGGSIAHRMWGPLPVEGPAGTAPGYVVLSAQQGASGPTTVERRFIPGVGLAREITTETSRGLLRVRLDSSIVPAK